MPVIRNYSARFSLLVRMTCLGMICLFTVAPGVVLAGSVTGAVEGRVTDRQSGQSLPGIVVFLKGTRLGTMTDSTGWYSISGLQPREYAVQFKAMGYRPVTMNGVTVYAGLRTRLDVSLEQSAIEMHAVEIRAERPLIQKDQPSTAFFLGDTKISRLPVSTYREILSLQPGVTLEGNVRGGRVTEVGYVVDGLPAQDLLAGGSGFSVPKSSLQSMTIQTGGFDAENGNAQSGIVDVSTKTGGDAHDLSARFEKDNWLSGSISKQTNRLTELEVSAGGPIVREQAHYFAAASATAHDTPWWQDFERFEQSPIVTEFSSIAKLDYEASLATRFTLQGAFYAKRWIDYDYLWRYNLSGLPEQRKGASRLTLSMLHSFSPVSSLHISLSRFDLRSRILGEDPSSTPVPMPYRYDFFLRYVIAGNRYWHSDTRQLTYDLQASYTEQVSVDGEIKFGGHFEQLMFDVNVQKLDAQTTYFGKPLLDRPLLNYADRFQYEPRIGSLFFQYKTRTNADGTTLKLGLRWDFLDPRAERPNVVIPASGNNDSVRVQGTTPATFKHTLSPRLAVAAPAGEGGFFFANFGMYVQYPLFQYLYAGVQPAQLQLGTRQVLIGNPDLDPERTTALEFGFKQTISRSMVGSITYFKKDIKNLIDSKTLVPFDGKLSGSYGFGSYVNVGAATSNGIEIMISKERGDELTGSLSYVYMVTEGSSEAADQVLKYSEWGIPHPAEFYPLSWDQRHTIKLDAEYMILRDLWANLYLVYNTGRPYTYYPTKDGFTPEDPTMVFAPNNRRMQDVFIVNLKTVWKSRLPFTESSTMTLYCDIRNLLNRKNVRWVDSKGRVGGELGDPTAYYELRRVRIGLELGF